jgi:hypothetical protein
MRRIAKAGTKKAIPFRRPLFDVPSLPSDHEWFTIYRDRHLKFKTSCNHKLELPLVQRQRSELEQHRSSSMLLEHRSSSDGSCTWPSNPRATLDELAWHMGQLRSLVLVLRMVLVLHKVLELVLHRVLELVLHRVLELHRSKQQELHHRCKPSCEHANVPTNLLASEQVHIRCHKLGLVLELVHKQRLQVHCKPLYERAIGSADLLALQQVHMHCRKLVREQGLGHSKKRQHRCNPCCGQKCQPKR